MNHPILVKHAEHLKSVLIADAALSRISESTYSVAGWSINTARHKIDYDAEISLRRFGETINLEEAVRKLFHGEVVNHSEKRPALHWALRCKNPAFSHAQKVKASLEAPFAFAEAIRDGKIRSANGKSFDSIIHIGIGGSDLGPRLLYDTFYKERDKRYNLRFCANLDPLDFELAVDELNPETTLVIGVSKSFRTEETRYNLNRAQRWLKSALDDVWSRHVALVTSNRILAEQWLGDSRGHIFNIPESVGGRYSIWSAGSLSCFISLGTDLINEIMLGAEAIDHHVKHEPINSNVAMKLALLDYWNSSVLKYPMRAELAYSRRLRLLPNYLQQLEMESNGKDTQTDGTRIVEPTTPAIWGGEGTLGQHSYHQWLHQSRNTIPTELILALDSEGDEEGQIGLISNALAQAEVLEEGRTLEQIQRDDPDSSVEISKQKVLYGQRPSTFLITKDFSPTRFGSLIALLEHRTYLAGRLWGINSFDQWGVEQGKILARKLKSVVQRKNETENHITQSITEEFEQFE